MEPMTTQRGTLVPEEWVFRLNRNGWGLSHYSGQSITLPPKWFADIPWDRESAPAALRAALLHVGGKA